MEGLKEREKNGENSLAENLERKSGGWHVQREYQGHFSPEEAFGQVIRAHLYNSFAPGTLCEITSTSKDCDK